VMVPWLPPFTYTVTMVLVVPAVASDAITRVRVAVRRGYQRAEAAVVGVPAWEKVASSGSAVERGLLASR
ncbi:MAG: hypothetical protein M3Q68_08945, partial [Actinomycetota bacterium]|nr:hypothetical protein [Actinomycetota bacterium]